MKVEELLQDQMFCEKVKSAESLEEVAKLFSDQGVEVTADELEKALAEAESGELSEENLENVAGGISVRTAAYIAGYIVATGRQIYKVNNKRNKM